jgi:hypothetical protein
MVKDKEIVCKNCKWNWNTDDSDESDKYICHKCGYNNKDMIKLKDILNEIISEMGEFTIQPVLDLYDKDPEKVSKAVFPYNKDIKSKDKIKSELLDADKDLFFYIMKKLDLQIRETEVLDEACWDGYQQQGMKKKGNRMVPNCVRVSEAKKKGKINPAYLTKDAAAMRKEIDRVKKLKSDDPSAYDKWDADYSDKAKTKKYKTKKSAATSAYEKRFGKKEK